MNTHTKTPDFAMSNPRPQTSNLSVDNDWDKFVEQNERRSSEMSRLKVKKNNALHQVKSFPTTQDFMDVEKYMQANDTAAVKEWMGAFGEESKNHRGENLAHLAIINGSKDVLAVVVEKGASQKLLSQVDNSGASPLVLAQKEQRWDMAEVLLRSGAKMNEDLKSLTFLMEKAPASHIKLMEDLGLKPYEKALSADLKAGSGQNELIHSEKIQRLVKDRGDQAWVKKLDDTILNKELGRRPSFKP